MHRFFGSHYMTKKIKLGNDIAVDPYNYKIIGRIILCVQFSIDRSKQVFPFIPKPYNYKQV